jgi:hypothetical protein
MSKEMTYAEMYDLGKKKGEDALAILSTQAMPYLPYVVPNFTKETQGYSAGMLLFGALQNAVREVYGYDFSIEDLLKYYNMK